MVCLTPCPALLRTHLVARALHDNSYTAAEDPHGGKSRPLPDSSAATGPGLQVNYNLLLVNAFMAMTGLYQLSRKVNADFFQKGDAAFEERRG
jgi:hypothetical protein